MSNDDVSLPVATVAADMPASVGEYKVELPRSRFKARLIDTTGLMNKRELVSIKALTAYVAYNQKVCEETVRAVLAAQFDVPTIDQLRRDDYERVIRFLVDVQMDLLRN